MDHSAEFPMRPVTPIDDFPEALFAALPGDDDTLESRAEELVALLDPITRRPTFPAIPKSLADQLTDTFARLDARGETNAAEARGAAAALLRLIDDAALIAGDMRGIMHLFRKAVDDDDLPLTAGHVVADVVETMAKRLDALEVQAQAIFDPLREARG